MIKFELVTLDGTKFAEDVYEVRLPTPDGEIGVFPHHMPLVSIASPGVVTLRRKQSDPDTLLEYFSINGGVIEILDNQIRVLVDEADRGEDINEAEIQKAHDEAKRLRAEAKDRVSLAHAQTLVDRTASQLKVAELKRHRKSRSRV